MAASVKVPSTALVLAAGLGNRLRAVAQTLPKPLVGFGGRPILAHNLAWLAASGVRTAYVNLHYGADQIRAAIGDGADFGLKVEFVYEPVLLGTAGAYGNIPALGGAPSFVVYGDNVIRCDLAQLWARHRACEAEATIALFDQARHAHTGIAGGRVRLGQDEAVEGFVEGGGAGLVNAGVYVLDPAMRDLTPPGRFADFGREVFPAMLAAGRPVQGFVMGADDFCLGLDTPESLARGQALLAQGRIRL